MKKIRTMGKLIRIIAKVSCVFVLLGAIFVSIGATCLLVLPKDMVAVESTETSTVNVDLSTVVSDVNIILQNKDKILEALEKRDITGDITISDEGILLIENNGVESSVALRGLGMSLVGLVLYLSSAFVVLLFVEKLGKNLENGNTPFCEDNIKYLKIIGFCLLGFATGPSFIGGIINDAFNISQKYQISYVYDFNFTTLLVGIVFIALIYIFEYGLKLQKEADETL